MFVVNSSINPQYPGAADDHGDSHNNNFWNKGQSLFVNLGCRLENRDNKTGYESRDENGCCYLRSHPNSSCADVNDSLIGQWYSSICNYKLKLRTIFSTINAPTIDQNKQDKLERQGNDSWR